MATKVPLPRFEDLPLNPEDPPLSAWGLWENSQLGALNYLTDEVVLRAAKEEIQTGIRVGLNLPLDFIKPALLGRIGFEHKMINKAPRVVNDDIITFNTQGSSQWDSFRHFAYQSEKKFYNGQAFQHLILSVTPSSNSSGRVTQDDIYAAPETPINGINAWASRGIAGRGVLIDYFSWAQEKGIKYDPTKTHPITLEEIKTIIAEKNITLRIGDILFLRTGYVSGYGSLDLQAKDAHKTEHRWPGFAQSEESVKWLWENQFAAVAADNPAFDCVPAVNPKYFLHPILLAGWGTPIGELFDLEALAQTCQNLGRYTFFLSSAPLNYTGAVASPPNVLAFF